MPENLLVVEGLTRRFGSHTVIADLSLAIQRGGRVALCAPSGAGKTTLLNILAGLDLRYEGRFTLAARRTATIFQEPRLLPHLTVQENIFLPLRLQRVPLTAELDGRYRRWLDVCGLAPYTRHFPYEISGGMKQKAALVRGFLTDPDFVMMDEPFTSLDVVSKRAVIRHILEAYPGITILFATHALDEVPLLAQMLLYCKTDRLASLNQLEATHILEAIYD